MIQFFKTLLSKINFKTDNPEINKLNKFIYFSIILSIFIFIGLILYFIIKQWPSFIEAVRYHWNESKTILNNFN